MLHWVLSQTIQELSRSINGHLFFHMQVGHGSGEARAKWRGVQDIGKVWGVHCFGPMGVQT
jgi:hypothetical protein